MMYCRSEKHMLPSLPAGMWVCGYISAMHHTYMSTGHYFSISHTCHIALCLHLCVAPQMYLGLHVHTCVSLHTCISVCIYMHVYIPAQVHSVCDYMIVSLLVWISVAAYLDSVEADMDF